MSDYYLCEHKSQCCGTCIRGIKTENNRLQSRLSRLEGVAEKMNTALYWCRRWIAEDGGASNAQIEEALAAYDSYRKGEGKP